jgi:protein SCO1
MSLRLGVVALAMAVGLAGCRGAAKPVASAGGVKEYAVRGVVVSTDAAHGEVKLKGEAIPGFMEAMTMSYAVADPAAISEMHPGDTIAATLVDGETAMTLKNVVIVGQAKPDYVPAVQYHVPAVGEVVPEFAMQNQSGKTIGLKAYRGKVVVMTFIYTRCPLADYCPKMSRNFAEIDKALQGDPKLYAKTHLLSVSFDPAYDTAKVLKSYGEAYTGRYTKETFEHWEFAAPSVAELGKMEEYFDVGVTPGQSGTLQHSLSTVIVDEDGRVVAFYPTNEWTVAEVVAKIRSAVG